MSNGNFTTTRKGHLITASDLNGQRRQQVWIKRNHISSPHPVWISTPPFFLLTEDAALELADLLVDVVESHRARREAKEQQPVYTSTTPTGEGANDVA